MNREFLNSDFEKFFFKKKLPLRLPSIQNVWLHFLLKESSETKRFNSTNFWQ